MDLFLKDKTISEDPEISKEPSELQKLYNIYKLSLPQFKLPPIGVSFVFF
jgi:hypothetical protein